MRRAVERCAPLAALALLGLGLAGCGDGALPASLWSAITDGQPDPGHPTVGELDSGCTATLVGQKTVLTAAHCVKTGGSYGFKLSSGSYTGTGKRHPGYNGLSLTNDIALVLLSQAPPVAPSAIANAAPSVGHEVTLVGFGVTSEYGNDYGVKRMAKNTIAKMTATTIVFYGSGNGTGNTCYGDSGGPAFATINGNEVVVGVTSGGNFCGNDGTDTRVDAFTDWVAQAAGGDVLQAGDTPPVPPDTEPPRVRIISPRANDSLEAGQVKVVVEATDNEGVATVQLAVEDSVVASASAPPFEFPIQLTEGQHTLRARALDDAGNAGEAVAVVVATADQPLDPLQPAPVPPPADPGPQAQAEEQLVGGCRISARACAPDPAVLLVLLGLLAARRRSR